MLAAIYDFWCRFIDRWTAIVPISHSIDEETGELPCGHSFEKCDKNGKLKMIEPAVMEWRKIDLINEMPEPVIHQKDCYTNSTTNNCTPALTDTDNYVNNFLKVAKSSSGKSSGNEKI